MKRVTNTEILLHEIAASGGMRFRAIQCRLWELGHPGQDSKLMERGDYCTYLLGGMFYHDGVLHTFCEKGDDGRWRVVRPIEPPWKRNEGK